MVVLDFDADQGSSPCLKLQVCSEALTAFQLPKYSDKYLNHALESLLVKTY